VPARISKSLGGAVSIPVRGRAAEVPFRSTLIARGAGKHRLYVHSRAWRCRGLDAGDSIAIELEHDPESRQIAVPADFLSALEDRPAARAAFAASTRALHQEIANWVAAAKQAQTRERRIEKALDVLEERWQRKRRKPATARTTR